MKRKLLSLGLAALLLLGAVSCTPAPNVDSTPEESTPIEVPTNAPTEAPTPPATEPPTDAPEPEVPERTVTDMYQDGYNVNTDPHLRTLKIYPDWLTPRYRA